MHLTDLQYDVLMQAIKNAQIEHVDGNFTDPYAENPNNYTDTDIEQALNQVETIVLAEYLKNK